MDFFTDGIIAYKKIFETDFDSIIYNLIINSIESFEHTKCTQRKISISIECSDNEILRFISFFEAFLCPFLLGGHRMNSVKNSYRL